MRTAPVVFVVFLLVLQRWVEMRTGWPEWAAFPALAVSGTVLLDRLLLPAGSRLTVRAWMWNVAIAGALGATLWWIGR